MFFAQRKWTPDNLVRFNAQRDEARAKQGLSPFRKLNEHEKAGLRAVSNKKALLDSESNQLTLQAWPLDRFPLKQAIAPHNGVLLCPQTLDQQNHKSGRPVKKISFREGQDLFKLAYGHYSETLPPSETPPGRNYVSNDGICSKRHEFLGPQPLVAGFYVDSDEGEAEILFWDPLLKLAWTKDGNWVLNAEFDEVVEAWVPVVRRKTA